MPKKKYVIIPKTIEQKFIFTNVKIFWRVVLNSGHFYTLQFLS